MVTGYIESISVYLNKVVKLNITGLDELVEAFDPELRGVDPSTIINRYEFTDKLKILSQLVQEEQRSLLLMIRKDHRLCKENGINALLIMHLDNFPENEKFRISYLMYKEKPIAKSLTIRL